MAVNFDVLDNGNFAEYIKNHDGIILFHKKLCPHCAVMMTVLGKVQPRLEGASFASVDSEEQPEVMAACGVERVPTIAVVRGGEIVARNTGVIKPAQVLELYGA